MFLYHLNHSFANQSIVSHQDNRLTIGDCLSDDQDNYYLVLGETIHRPHLYNIWQAPAQLYSAHAPLLQGGIKGGSEKKTTDKILITTPTLNLIHHLVYEYYTTYANIIKLYLPNDISKLLKKHHHPTIPPSHPLTLIIMPDWRTIINKQSEYNYTLEQAIWSQHTINQDIKLFRNIKHGQESNSKSPRGEITIVCTPGECFWDYPNLSQIILVDPHKWYYKSQQEPRYDIARVCELMAHYYGCTLTTNT
jgi:hypothetical protein